ncbi:MAG: hypothetical protein O7C56_01035 [Rickettsia endosymbiont of Ixodes persulcatus]|nr:hypothetical protein [Rickettsia endosymbiont of Ixodes persulcatus]
MVIQFQGFRSSPSSANLPVPALDVVREVEAKYPALLFKQQLTAYVEKIYGIIRDNLKKEISSFLSLCIQVLLTSFINSIQPNLAAVNFIYQLYSTKLGSCPTNMGRDGTGLFI